MEALVVLCTVPDEETAAKLAETLVQNRLAACVNIIGPHKSVYEWKGKLEKDTEFLLVIKTATGRFEALAEKVVQLHPYEVPEIIALPVLAGNAAYLDWVKQQTAS